MYIYPNAVHTLYVCKLGANNKLSKLRTCYIAPPTGIGNWLLITATSVDSF